MNSRGTLYRDRWVRQCSFTSSTETAIPGPSTRKAGSLPPAPHLASPPPRLPRSPDEKEDFLHLLRADALATGVQDVVARPTMKMYPSSSSVAKSPVCNPSDFSTRAVAAASLKYPFMTVEPRMTISPTSPGFTSSPSAFTTRTSTFAIGFQPIPDVAWIPFCRRNGSHERRPRSSHRH